MRARWPGTSAYSDPRRPSWRPLRRPSGSSPIEERYIYIEERTDGAGYALVTIFVDDLDGQVASSAARGLEPEQRETYDNGVRKVTFRDPDGNQIGFGGAPLEA